MPRCSLFLFALVRLSLIGRRLLILSKVIPPAWLCVGIQRGFVRGLIGKPENVVFLASSPMRHFAIWAFRFSFFFPMERLPFIVCRPPFSVYSPSTFQAYLKPCPRHGCVVYIPSTLLPFIARRPFSSILSHSPLSLRHARGVAVRVRPL